MRIAILGTRGVPACYGGFETFAEELGKRLVERGHEVCVYSRRGVGKTYDGPDEYLGMQIRVAPTILHKYLETPLAALTSFCDLFRQKRYDAVLVCNAANSPFAWLIKLRGIPFAVNVDGIERNRAKWNALGRAWYRLGELCSVLFATRVIADAEVIAEYYRQTYRCSSAVIAYGANPAKCEPGPALVEFGLQANKYLLYVSRLEPENNALGVIEAYTKVQTDMPLVIVGDAPYADDYKSKLRAAADERVIFTGYQFGESYREFISNCYLYVQATEVGGTHPALIESMAVGNCVVANGTPENREVLADAGEFYEVNQFEELSGILQSLVQDPARAARHREAARSRALQCYDWEVITDRYEALFEQLATGVVGKKTVITDG